MFELRLNAGHQVVWDRHNDSPWRDSSLAPWLDSIHARLSATPEPHGDLAKWLHAIASLPCVKPREILLDSGTVRIGRGTDIDANTQTALQSALRQFMPWRKGPFSIFDIHIDTEWRSDWKWQRIAPHLAPLANRTVLDVGCGSGYHCWRMRGAGAAFVLGIDPYWLFNMQFRALQHFVGDHHVEVLPLRGEDMPPQTQSFDTVFSMGVLYHRRAPLDHLRELHEALRDGGELVLETLVIEGDANALLQPRDRYAKMRNVFNIPSCLLLGSWLKQAGFRHIRCANVADTTTAEQHRTEWMRFESLADFLDATDSTRTIEGYPAPRRAVMIAER